MTDNRRQSNQRISVGRDFNVTADNGSNVAIGDISGQVQQSIRQVPDKINDHDIGLKNILLSLENAIKNEAKLPDPQKVIALEQVNTIAKACQNPKDNALKQAAQTATFTLNGIAQMLPTATKIVEGIGKLTKALAKILIF
ncbi:RfrA pentapeptide repeat-containing protein [Thalassoporum mexicanum PCC 7367]|uniref:hypothetical protein n=1 Tax=Thalassoporum mexicanum TaxID=3457544 RepID=UPI00029F8E46|nr:hypothetical protein [Pseudanabaena sp. PCC 7367]AFY68380.1 RfrA pentapeptide repeat-containing protein [Pseudanabaena sp. PCC 7367]